MSAATRPRRLAVIGAECSGKTSLVRALAERLPAIRLPERLREFCDATGRTPRADEQVRLIDEQIEREAQAIARAAAEGVAWVISDTTPLMTALYSIAYFQDDALLEQAIDHQRGYALTLLADIDLPWQADGIQRDSAPARDAFQQRLVLTLEQWDLPHLRLGGGHEARIAAALAAVRRV